ncbi:sugar ABC transporter ATP-binding protein [Marinomonas algicola]|uniref:sugar ABC transporter ATP-binding protein n=1 Tax=Marinomonas algicola TaxID=2773454 RepID=UPI00174A7BE8|nr:sugar ABC transporter ATP-binding protein [Marinomonas algicola]
MSVHSNTQSVTTHSADEILRVQALHKHFGGVKALQGVNFSLKRGEVHALVGENGAGKSTLIKVLTGVHKFDSGAIFLNDEDYRPETPKQAKAQGIQVVHQEFNLLTHMSVAENICFEAFPKTRFGLLDQKEMNKRARIAMDAIGLTEVNVNESISRLGIAYRQQVEIARALQSKSQILILDEPTATLTDRETEKLFHIVDTVKKQGVTVVFVSHHLNEVFSICDRVTVFRNGESIITEEISQTTPDRVVSNMVGKHLEQEMSHDTETHEFGEVALSAKRLRVPQSPHEAGVSFDLRYGEILGIAGLVGAGRTELLRSLFGAQEVVSGDILRNNKVVEFKKPADAIAAGIGFVTEDRKEEGLILDMSIAINSSLAAIDQVSSAGLMQLTRENEMASRIGKTLNLKCGDVKDNVSSLSGGNQQKVVLAKWLARHPDVFMLDEPTRGVDVGAKAEIYAILRDLARDGMALLVVSSEMPELMTLCDRIVVLANHEIKGELTRENFSQESILQLAYKSD